ncbi:MAG: hypothetical protein FJZ96_12075, partial [Chloroflexi bacterium]|nr:hypothetical protein [Chloroflexota bacterium]
MDKMKQIIRANWQIPAITFGLTLLSFALLLPALHYYLDDWPMLYSLHIRGAEGIKQLYLYDGRPFAFWPHLLLYQVGGTDPVFWHLANYLLRWLTGIFLWGAFKHLWPNNRREVSWAAILFAIYPLFAQQSMGLTFIVIWTGYLLYSISLFLMVSALRNRKYLWLLLFLSILVSLLGLVTLEYFIGVEFLRPLIIWIILSEDGRARAGIKQALKFWSPYLLATALYLVWRFFFVESVWRDLTPSMLSNFLHDPITTALQLVNFLLRDTLEMTLGVWFPAFDAAIFDLTAPVRNLALLLSLFVTAAFVFVLLKQRPMQQVNGREDRSGFWIQSLSIGLAGVVLGCAPGWLIGRSVTDTYGLWNDRFGLAAMFGASYFIIGSLGLVSRGSRLKREIFLAILVGFAVGRNFTVTDEYRWSSTWQNQFYSQLKWRAPYIESGTSILADNEMFPKMGVYATSFALNMLYPGVEPMPGMDYWFFTL